MRQALILFVVVLLFSVFLFIIPNSLFFFAFSGHEFFKGELWRIITFQFVHISLAHLAENLAAFSIISLLAFELKLSGIDFMNVFIIPAIIIAFMHGLIFPYIVIAGLSLGTYSVLGSLAIKGSNFIPKLISIPLFGVCSFSSYLLEFDKTSLRSSIFHLSGFITGIIILYLFAKLKKQKRILQLND